MCSKCTLDFDVQLFVEIYVAYCVACKAWSTHRDHICMTLSAASGRQTFGFRSMTFLSNASISFKVYRRVKHHKIQVKLEKGGLPQGFD